MLDTGCWDFIKYDNIVKSPKALIYVIPVKTGPAFGGIN